MFDFFSTLTGNIGRKGTGLHPLRGQNNVQGASDVGLIPMVFPDYQPISDQKNVEVLLRNTGTQNLIPSLV